jgi:hypothetical protein
MFLPLTFCSFGYCAIAAAARQSESAIAYAAFRFIVASPVVDQFTTLLSQSEEPIKKRSYF